ncbi:hypothetical protein BDP27DRAFT_1332236, partial [Rhodocollybia butyracea]
MNNFFTLLQSLDCTIPIAIWAQAGSSNLRQQQLKKFSRVFATPIIGYADFHRCELVFLYSSIRVMQLHI